MIFANNFPVPLGRLLILWVIKKNRTQATITAAGGEPKHRLLLVKPHPAEEPQLEEAQHGTAQHSRILQSPDPLADTEGLGMLFLAGQNSDAAASFPMQVWQRVAWSLASRIGLSCGKSNPQKICSYLQFFFFFCKNIDFPARSLNCSSKCFIAWVGGFPSAFKSTFPLKMSLREGCLFLSKSL